MKSVDVLFLFLGAVLIAALSIKCRKLFFASSSGLSLWIDLLEILCVVISAFIAMRQLRASKEIARASFIRELNQSYVDNEDYMKIYNALQECFDGVCRNKGTETCTDCKLQFAKGTVSNYLTFFETIYILNKKGVLTFDIIDDLFAYRFFIAVHSVYFQQTKLAAQPENFKNIFKLEHNWLEYRIKIGKNKREEIDSACGKFRIARWERKECLIEWNNIYEARVLRGLVDEEKYQMLIK